MAQMSPGATSAVSSFAGSLGLEARPASDGSYNFIFERLGTLSIAAAEDGRTAIIALSRQPRTNAATSELSLLAQAGFSMAYNRIVHAALAADGSHVLAVEMDDTALNLPELDDALRVLGNLHDAVAR